MSEYLSLETLTTPRKLEERDVPVPLLGGKVRIRGCTVAERTRFDRSVQGKGKEEIRQRLVAAAVIEPNGFTAEHVKALSKQDARIIEPIVNEALDLWGLSEVDVESLEGN